MPPSLRRTFSTPSVRASPYSASSRIPRRSCSGSTETSRRRILADLDWWRVTEGQREQDNQPDGTTDNVPGAALELTVLSIGSSEMTRDWAASFVSSPETPRHRRHYPVFQLNTTQSNELPVDGLRRSMAELDLVPRVSATRIASPANHRTPAPLFRAHTFDPSFMRGNDAAAVPFAQFAVSTFPSRQLDLFN